MKKINFKMILQCGIQSGAKTEHWLMKYVLQGQRKAELNPTQEKKNGFAEKLHSLSSFCSALGTSFNKTAPCFLLSTK